MTILLGMIMILLFQVVILIQIMLMHKQVLQQLKTKSESREDSIEFTKNFEEESCIEERLPEENKMVCEVGENPEMLLNEVLSEVFS